MDERLAILYYKNHFIHRPSMMSPENPERISQVVGYLQGRTRLFPNKALLLSEFPPVTRDDLLRVHDEEYVAFVEKYSLQGGGFLGDSTYFSKNTFKAAQMSAGGAKEACRIVLDGEHPCALALIRPPGHHATQDRYGGYCIFNNAAVAIRAMQAAGKIKTAMVVDWDAHAGNGTMRIFYEDPSVLTVSIHRDPHDFYPHDGYSHQIGRGKGRGYTVNVEMPQGAGDEAYREAMRRVVLPLISQFKPDLLVALNGFDAHYSDPVVKLSMTTRGFYETAKSIRAAGRKSVFLMEGGYTTRNGPLTQALVEGMLGDELSALDEMDPLSSTVVSPDRVFKTVDSKIKVLAEALKDYWEIG